MKTLLTTALMLLLMTTLSYSQKITGVATYKTDRKIDLKMDSTQVDNGMKEMILAQLKKSSQKEYELTFNSEESLYKKVEKLNKPSPASVGIMIEFTESSSILYRNTKDSKYVNKTEISGKPFLIKDAAVQPEWVLGKEVKNIGEYTCFKATWTRDVEEADFDALTNETTTKTVTKTTTAWYTLDVPVSHGPTQFWGLPGLILEVEDGDVTILCSKVVINPDKGVTIDVPSKGKEVTQEEFDAIEMKKMEEMMDNFKSMHGRKGDTQVMFQIGG